MRTWDKVGVSRRAFLGGAAAVVALPWLETIARSDVARPGAAPLRALFWYIPNGMRMDRFVPAQTGPAYTTPELLLPLEAFRDRLLVLSNVAQAPALGSVAGDHARGTGAFLTCQAPGLPTDPVVVGPSIDYLLSQAPAAIGTRLPYLHLSTAGAATAGCDSGYPCAYQNAISWSEPGVPIPARTDPREAFEALFSGFDPGMSLAEQQRRYVRRTSVLDHVLEDATRLRGRVSVRDQARVDQYLTSIRELELRVLADVPGSTGACEPGAPPEPYYTFAQQLDLHTDVLVKAMECDATRVLTMTADRSGSGRSFAFMGVPEAHHEMSHWNVAGEVDHRLEQWTAICAWHMARVGDLLARLDATVDVDGCTLLDNSMVFVSSEIGDGHTHNHVDLPVVLVGGGGGRVLSGQHLRFGAREPLANLFVGMLGAFGSTATTFGVDGTRPMAGVFAA
jgi:hypothetical protein